MVWVTGKPYTRLVQLQWLNHDWVVGQKGSKSETFDPRRSGFKMKRKFSLSSLRLVSLTFSTTKINLQFIEMMEHPSSRQNSESMLMWYQKIVSTEDVSTTDELSSPPYSPTPSVMERPVLSSRLESQLRRACAIIVEESNPPASEYDDIPDYHETLRKYKEQHHTRKEARSYRPETQPVVTRHVRGSEADQFLRPTPYVHVPKNAAASFEATTALRKSSARLSEGVAEDVVEPAQPAVFENPRYNRSRSDEQVVKLRVAVSTRPRTSGAACVEHTGPSVDTSSSTTRTNTTYDGFRRTGSTGLSSLASPYNEKKSSPSTQRVSEQILQDGPSASLADATAKAWMAQELSRRRRHAEPNSGRSARPSTRSSSQPKWSNSDRPVSRAGTIAESVKMGLRDYIRPRASTDSMQSTRSESGLARGYSRGDRDHRGSGNSWWRGSRLKGKGSWSSFRSARPDEVGGSNAVTKDGEPNLNRALPALPGLDQYKERKPLPTHISQLMRPGQRNCGKPTPPPPAPDSYQHFLAEAEQKARQDEQQRAIEQRMKRDAMMASAQFGLHPNIVHRRDTPRSASHPATFPLAPPTSHSQLAKPSMPAEKSGLLRRISRFWGGHGTTRGISSDGKAYANMVVAN